jgi:hypothetical protein
MPSEGGGALFASEPRRARLKYEPHTQPREAERIGEETGIGRSTPRPHRFSCGWSRPVFLAVPPLSLSVNPRGLED